MCTCSTFTFCGHSCMRCTPSQTKIFQTIAAAKQPWLHCSYQITLGDGNIYGAFYPPVLCFYTRPSDHDHHVQVEREGAISPTESGRTLGRASVQKQGRSMPQQSPTSTVGQSRCHTPGGGLLRHAEPWQTHSLVFEAAAVAL